jgi:hypothetical protein
MGKSAKEPHEINGLRKKEGNPHFPYNSTLR